MRASAAAVAEPEIDATTETERAPAFRVRPIMKQGTASSLAQTWMRFATLQAARDAVKTMYHDDRVMRALIVIDDAPPRFVEWVER